MEAKAKQKWYLSDETIQSMADKAYGIVSASKLKRLADIGRKMGLELTGCYMNNLQAFWTKCVRDLKALPEGNKFRTRLLEENRWGSRTQDRDSIHEYIKWAGYWSDFEFLSDPCWKELENYLSDIRQYGVEATGLKTFIELEGDLKAYLGQYSKKQCDPKALELSTKIHSAIEPLLKGTLPEMQFLIGAALSDYCAMPEEERTAQILHNKIFKF